MDGNWWSSSEQQIELAPCFLGLICNFVILIWVLYMAIYIINFLFLVLYLGDLLVQDVLPSKSFFLFLYTSKKKISFFGCPMEGGCPSPGAFRAYPRAGPGSNTVYRKKVSMFRIIVSLLLARNNNYQNFKNPTLKLS
jgi:hypothetical protein